MVHRTQHILSVLILAIGVLFLTFSPQTHAQFCPAECAILEFGSPEHDYCCECASDCAAQFPTSQPLYQECLVNNGCFDQGNSAIPPICESTCAGYNQTTSPNFDECCECAKACTQYTFDPELFESCWNTQCLGSPDGSGDNSGTGTGDGCGCITNADCFDDDYCFGNQCYNADGSGLNCADGGNGDDGSSSDDDGINVCEEAETACAGFEPGTEEFEECVEDVCDDAGSSSDGDSSGDGSGDDDGDSGDGSGDADGDSGTGPQIGDGCMCTEDVHCDLATNEYCSGQQCYKENGDLADACEDGSSSDNGGSDDGAACEDACNHLLGSPALHYECVVENCTCEGACHVLYPATVDECIDQYCGGGDDGSNDGDDGDGDGGGDGDDGDNDDGNGGDDDDSGGGDDDSGDGDDGSGDGDDGSGDGGDGDDGSGNNNPPGICPDATTECAKEGNDFWSCVFIQCPGGDYCEDAYEVCAELLEIYSDCIEEFCNPSDNGGGSCNAAGICGPDSPETKGFDYLPYHDNAVSAAADQPPSEQGLAEGPNFDYYIDSGWMPGDKQKNMSDEFLNSSSALGGSANKVKLESSQILKQLAKDMFGPCLSTKEINDLLPKIGKPTGKINTTEPIASPTVECNEVLPNLVSIIQLGDVCSCTQNVQCDQSQNAQECYYGLCHAWGKGPVTECLEDIGCECASNDDCDTSKSETCQGGLCYDVGGNLVNEDACYDGT